ncbi:MAG: ABC transporter permease, partial [Isosphaeraceae bacterium]
MRKNTLRATRQFSSLLPDTFRDVSLVASWDIVRQARRPSFFALRLLIALVISFQFITMWYANFSESGRFNNSGLVNFSYNQIIFAVRSIYMGSLSVLAVAVIVLCPILTVGTVAGDRERKIWYDLVNSPLSGWSILMGKMVGRLATVFGWVLAVLPVWAILGLVGGLDPATVLKGFIATLMYGWFYAAIGLFASVLCGRTRDAVGLATGLVLLVLFSPALAGFAIYLTLGNANTVVTGLSVPMQLYMLNPIAAVSMFGLSGSGVIKGDWLNLGLISLLGPALTVINGLILRPVSRRLESKTGRKNQSHKLFTNQADEAARDTAPARDLFSRADGQGWLSRTYFSPMAIKERKVRGSSRLTRIIKNFILMIGLFTASYFLLTLGLEALKELRQY